MAAPGERRRPGVTPPGAREAGAREAVRGGAQGREWPRRAPEACRYGIMETRQPNAAHAMTNQTSLTPAPESASRDASADVPARLRDALAARDWARAVALVGTHWPVLLDNPAEHLDDALREIPLSAIAQDSRAAAVRDIRLHAFDDAVDRMLGVAPLPAIDDLGALDDIARSDGALNLLNVAAARMIAFRVRGKMFPAVQLAALVERFGRIAVVHQPALVTPRLPAALLQAGITRGLADDIPGALLTLRDAYERGPDARSGHVQRDAAGKAALFLALSGDIPGARDWTRRHDAAPTVSGWYEPRIALTADIARSLIAIETLDRPAAESALATLEQPVNSEQNWGAGVTYARARHALAWGDRLGQIDAVRQDRTRYDSWLGEGTTFGPLLAAAEADLLISVGREEPARRAIAVHAEHPIGRVVRARVELLAGNDDAAARQATGALAESPTARYRTEALGLHALANLRRERTDDAGEAYAHFRESVRANELHLSASSVPSEERDALGHPLDDDVPTARDTVPRGTRRVALTPQQRLVLNGLEKGLTLRQIGAREHLSLNTMKTHARALYRRLDVATRDEAVARAYEVGLL